MDKRILSIDMEVIRINKLFLKACDEMTKINELYSLKLKEQINEQEIIEKELDNDISDDDSYSLDVEEKIDIRNIMVIDVETAKTGELIQIAYNIYDSNFDVIKEYNCLIDEGIGKVDFYEKYTIDDIVNNGLDPRDVFHEIKHDIKECSHVIGHNIAFDMGKIDKYFEKLNISYKKPISVCTMHKTKNLCKLLNKRGQLKPPKLSELYFHCFGTEPDNTKTHTANYDIEITFMCFYYLYQNNKLKL